jgi:hypothetical protein
MTVPIVPGAIILDLANGGAKDWVTSPYPALGAHGFRGRVGSFRPRHRGRGHGCDDRRSQGRPRLASATWNGYTVGALVAANPVGQVTVGDTPHFHAAPLEFGDEFGGLGPARPPLRSHAPAAHQGHGSRAGGDRHRHRRDRCRPDQGAMRRGSPPWRRTASPAPSGPATRPWTATRSSPSSTGRAALRRPRGLLDLMWLGHLAALCLSRAIARGRLPRHPGAGRSETHLGDGSAEPAGKSRLHSDACKALRSAPREEGDPPCTVP